MERPGPIVLSPLSLFSFSSFFFCRFFPFFLPLRLTFPFVFRFLVFDFVFFLVPVFDEVEDVLDFFLVVVLRFLGPGFRFLVTFFFFLTVFLGELKEQKSFYCTLYLNQIVRVVRRWVFKSELPLLW